MAETGKYEKFRELLREGIGTRTQKEFAESTGIARETISRLLNKELIPQPERETLSRISKQIKTCTMNDLLESCGYPRVSLEENVEYMENDLLAGINSQLHGIWTSVEEFAGVIDCLWISNGKLLPSDKEVEVVDKDNPADYHRDIILRWMFEGYKCSFGVRLFYVKNKKNHIVFTSYKELDENSTTDWVDSKDRYSDKERHIMHTLVKVPSKTRSEEAEKRLLADIFGEGVETFIRETVTGNGFYYDPQTEDDMKLFKNFMCAHAGSYCTNEKESDVFQLVLNHEGLLNELEDKLLDNSTTMADIIADVMARETGIAFEAYPDEEEGKDGSTIMYKCSNRREIDNASVETLYSISMYAKELNIPKFGACYWESREPKTGKVYNTSEFYLTERKNKK